MAPRYKNQWFQLRMANGFIADENEDGVIIYNAEKGSGAINIMSYTIPTHYIFDLQKELKNFVKVIDVNLETTTHSITHKDRAYTEFTTENTRWRVWLFYKNNVAVFATYNSDVEDSEMEKDDVNTIIESIEIF